MYIYNVTVNVLENSEPDWLEWMQKTHIPAMLATGKFTKATLVQVMVKEEMGGVTYSVQYTTKSKEMLEAYYKQDADRLQNEALKIFANQFVAFRTELKVIGEFTL